MSEAHPLLKSDSLRSTSPRRTTNSSNRGGYTQAPEPTGTAHRCRSCIPCRQSRAEAETTKTTHPEAAKERKKEHRLIVYSCLAIFGFLGFGTVVYTFAFPLVGPNGENATAVDALYFSMVTLTTVGRKMQPIYVQNADVQIRVPEYALEKTLTPLIKCAGILHSCPHPPPKCYGDYSIDIENDGAVAFTCAFCLLGISFAVAKLLDAQEDALAQALVDVDSNTSRARTRRTSFIRLRWGDDEWRLFNSIAIFLCFFFLGLGVFMGVEDAPFLKALFYVVTSMTTVGYGTTGSAPTTDGTKVFSTVWLGFATLALGHMVSKIIGYKLSSKIHSIRDRVLTHALDKDFFNDIDASNGVVDGEIDRAEWLCYNLLKGEYGISKEELNQINSRFDDLDKDKSGRLTPKELEFSLARSASPTYNNTTYE